MNITDISAIPRNKKIYNGTTKKYGITVDNEDYIVKYDYQHDMSVYSEYIAAKFMNDLTTYFPKTDLNISCQTVSLGSYKGISVSIIKDFTYNQDVSLHTYKELRQSIEDTELRDNEYTYNEIKHITEKCLDITDDDKEKAQRQFWSMFICDAILGNSGRHYEDWGYIKTGTGFKPAPIYSNADSLNPNINNSIHEYEKGSRRRRFIRDRVLMFPTSRFKMQRPDGSVEDNYIEMFRDLRVNKVFAEQVKKFRETASWSNIFNIMRNICDDIPLGVWYRRFYIEIVTVRYMCIILRMNFDKSYKLVEEALKYYE